MSTTLISTNETDQILSITPEAADKVREAAAKAGAEPHLRVGAIGGGCSGFKYQLAFDHQRDDDIAIECEGVRLLLAKSCRAILTGSTVTYEDKLMGGGFQVQNPNAVAACGCGDSFRVTDDSDCASDAADTYL